MLCSVPSGRPYHSLATRLTKLPWLHKLGVAYSILEQQQQIKITLTNTLSTVKYEEFLLKFISFAFQFPIFFFFFFLLQIGPSCLFPPRISFWSWLIKSNWYNLMDRPIPKPLYLHRTTHVKNNCMHTCALSRIRTQSSSVWASEDSMRLKPCGHCDRPVVYSKS
jgi:hypothetical protein